MSSSYSSLDWVLSHCAHFTVRRFICVYVFVFCFFSHCILVILLEHSEMDLMGLKADP